MPPTMTLVVSLLLSLFKLIPPRIKIIPLSSLHAEYGIGRLIRTQ